MKSISRKTAIAIGAAIALFGAGILAGKASKPATIIHVVTIKWKEGATAAQKQEVLTGVEKMGAEISGVKNVWTKSLKVQGDGYTSAFVMEFDSPKSFQDYVDNPVHQAWNKMYQSHREESTTHDITN